MSASRSTLSEEKRGEIRHRFFENQENRRKSLEQECVNTSRVFVCTATYIPTAYLFLTGVCTSSLLLLTPFVAGAYAGKKLGLSVANCLFKENKDPDDEVLIAFDKQSKHLLP